MQCFISTHAFHYSSPSRVCIITHHQQQVLEKRLQVMAELKRQRCLIGVLIVMGIIIVALLAAVIHLALKTEAEKSKVGK